MELRSTDIQRFKILKIGESLSLGHASGQHLKYIFDTHTHTSDARFSAALLRIVGNTFLM